MKRPMQWVGHNKKLFAVGVFIILALGLVYAVQSVFALNGNLPGGLDAEAGGQQGAIELHLKYLSVAQVTENRIAAYYPGWDASANNKSITISGGPRGNVCNIDQAVRDGSGTLTITIEIEGNSKTYTRDLKNVCGNDADSNFYGNTFDFPDGTLIKDPNIDRYKAKIFVRYNVPGAPPNQSGGSDLNYKMSISGNNSGNGTLALRSSSSAQTFGMRSSYTNSPSAAPNNTLRLAVPFGYHCSANVDEPFTRQVQVYDADGVFGDTYMWVEKNDNKLPRDAYGNTERTDRWEEDQKRWKLAGSNETENSLTIKKEYIERGAKYELVMVNTGGNVDNRPDPYSSLSVHYNTLSVGIPQDSIYIQGNCEYKLIPAIDIDTSTYVYYPNIQVTGSISENPNGPVPEAHPWEIYAVRYPSEPSTRLLTNSNVADGNPCTNGVLPSGGTGCTKISPGLNYEAQSSRTLTYAGGGPDPVGTRLCFFTRIQNPEHLVTDDTDWVYSDMRCSVSVKKPRVQFLGSDLRVGGNATSSYYNVQGNNYGSWVEYGMFTAGSNSIVSSGNGLRNGNPDGIVANWNRLTFANTPSYGGYSPVPAASSAYTYFRSLPISGGNFSQGNPTTGVYDLGNNPTIGNLNVNANGRSIILRATGTITIGNITVLNQGVTNATNLSQVVVVADNIEFTNSATRADAWLITSPAGYINTCNIGAQALTNGPCSGVLTVNGPVYTNRLMLRRTGGANPPGAAQLSEPAERFNLRPDAQLWAYTYANRADYAQTDYVQELPPRY